MTGGGDDEKKDKRRTGYQVGYGKPPVRTQFAKGASGNPNGRPRGSKNKPVEVQGGVFRDRFLREAQRKPSGQQMGGLTMIEAAIRRTFADAIRGGVRAQELILRQMSQISQADEALETEFTKTMIEAKVYGEEELERRARLGLTDEPELVPHPDDIHIEFHTGNIKVRGLQSKEDREFCARLRAQAKVIREGIAGLDEMIASEKSSSRRKELKQFRAVSQAKFDEIKDALAF